MTNPIKRKLLFIAVLAVWTVATFGVGYLVGLSIPEKKIAKASMSPDSRFAAFVREHPSIDPPNQSLWIKENKSGKETRIAKLPEDMDSIMDIHWSPNSEIVLFNTYMSLYGVRLTDHKTKKIVKKTCKKIVEITFGKDSFSYRFPEETEPILVVFDSQ